MYIKSMLNYTGGKYKILPQIMPHFPSEINTFVDLFCGGGNVFINAQAKSIIANDVSNPIIDLLSNLKQYGLESLGYVDAIINKYELRRNNREGYASLRMDYNKNPSWDKFYALICHSFSNQIRFNKTGHFNMPFGKRTFNPSMREKFQEFVQRLQEINVSFVNGDFMNFRIEDLDSNDFMFIDPPYLLGVATYNENGAWNLTKEIALLEYLDELNTKGVKWALTNVTHHKGMVNEYLIEFAKFYKTIQIDNDYKQCNYQIKETEGETREILVLNY
jgi:DNA adenine methylase